MAEGMIDIYHAVHTDSNHIAVSVLSATGRGHTIICQTEWCYSVYIPDIWYLNMLTGQSDYIYHLHMHCRH